MADRYVVKLTMREAIEIGIVRCTCGHPINNHHEWKPRPCAHCACRRYVAKFTRGSRLSSPPATKTKKEG